MEGQPEDGVLEVGLVPGLLQNTPCRGWVVIQLFGQTQTNARVQILRHRRIRQEAAVVEQRARHFDVLRPGFARDTRGLVWEQR